MKEFFEEYGGVIVTVLIILGIILIGYFVAGNGMNSSMGISVRRYITSMANQANKVLDMTNTQQGKTGGEVATFIASLLG